MNTDLTKKLKNNIDKDFFMLMNNAVLEKLWEMYGNIEILNLSTTERSRNYLVSEPNYHTTKFFTENLLAKEIKNTEILMNKLVYLGLSIRELSKMLMYEFFNNYLKSK